jgi:hypothetical protein
LPQPGLPDPVSAAKILHESFTVGGGAAADTKSKSPILPARGAGWRKFRRAASLPLLEAGQILTATAGTPQFTPQPQFFPGLR